MHHSREGVVGGLGHVDVVIWVDRRLGTQGTAQNFDGSVGDDFVGVHVGLGTGTGLEDNQWEMFHQLTLVNLGCCLLDGFGQLWVQSTQFGVDLGGSLLQDTEGFDDWLWHSFSGTTDLEVLV